MSEFRYTELCESREITIQRTVLVTEQTSEPCTNISLRSGCDSEGKRRLRTWAACGALGINRVKP